MKTRLSWDQQSCISQYASVLERFAGDFTKKYRPIAFIPQLVVRYQLSVGRNWVNYIENRVVFPFFH
ncbi:hypothetical protein H6H02_15315 [Coleofasciculus sp. FACHB-1120]|nr:hypothetical protein [Coleofasciculus sp. FACHB-1120]